MTTQPAPIGERPHALYRFYDDAGALLYIGITVNLPTRLADHRSDKPWWTTVANITVENHDTRAEVLAAEKAAIIAERPLHNVQHNTGRSAGTAPQVLTTAPGDANQWQFKYLRSGRYTTMPLHLYWEVHCDPISDDYYVDDITPTELWRAWLTRYPRDEQAEKHWGPGAKRIWWYVQGDCTFELAPHQPHLGDTYAGEEDFLASYSLPRNAETGEYLQWGRLPVVDKVWRTANLPEAHAFKGGFIQEATGWKPSPLQPHVDVHQLARMSGLYYPAGGR